MRRTINNILLLFSLLLVSACSKGEFMDFEPDYDQSAEWAVAYALGDANGYGLNEYSINFIIGRTDDEMNLISAGSRVQLYLFADENAAAGLPEGDYQSSDDAGNTFSLYCGGTVSGTYYGGTYVQIYRPGAIGADTYKIRQSIVSVTMLSEDEYHIVAELVTNEFSYRIDYSGELSVYSLGEL